MGPLDYPHIGQRVGAVLPRSLRKRGWGPVHGRPIIKKLTLNDLDRSFGRKT